LKTLDSKLLDNRNDDEAIKSKFIGEKSDLENKIKYLTNELNKNINQQDSADSLISKNNQLCDEIYELRKLNEVYEKEKFDANDLLE
jgi:hypothetical protein